MYMYVHVHVTCVVCMRYIQGLVIAGIADVTRPAHKLSITQSGALAATGIIHVVLFFRAVLYTTQILQLQSNQKYLMLSVTWNGAF